VHNEQPPDYYHDFSLTVELSARDAASALCTVSVRAEPPGGEGHQDTTRLRLDTAREYAANLLPSGPPSAQSRVAKALGEALLPSGPVRDAVRRALDAASRQQAGLRLRLLLADPELAALPWELGSIPLLSDEASEDWVHLARHPGLSVVRQAALSVGPATDPRDAHGAVVVGTALTVAGSWRDAAGHERQVEELPRGSAGDTVLATDALSGAAFEVERVVEPLTRAALRGALDQRVWGFYFGGHGYRDGIVLAGPGGPAEPEPLPSAELAELLVRAEVAVAILASCDSATPATAPDHPADQASEWYNLAETLVRAGVPYVVGMRGPVTDGTALQLSRVIFDGLAAYRSVDRAMAEARAADRGWWQLVLHSSSPAEVRVVSGPQPAPGALRAWHLPPDWAPGDARPAPSDGHPARLDVLWCLDRGPLRGVLADRAGTDLAAELSSVEEDVLREWAVRGVDPGAASLSVPRRRWFTLADTPAAGEPPRTRVALERLITSPAGLQSHLNAAARGASIGLVVRCDQGGARFDPATAVGYLAELTRSWPDAALVAHVTAALPHEALLVAADIGRRIPARRADLADLGTTVLTRVLPSTAAAEPPPAEETALSRIQRLQAGRSRPPAPQEARIRETLKALDEAATGTTPLPELVGLLRGIRDEQNPSDDYVALLRHHARHGAARAVSLAAASSRDEDLDAWVAVSEAHRPFRPAELPAGLLSQEGVNALVLALIRRCGGDAAAVRRAVAPWRGQVSTPVRRVADHLASEHRTRAEPQPGDRADREFLLGCPEVFAADTALRAGLGRQLTVTDLSPGARPAPAAWALLARRPLDHDTARLVAGWPLDLRRVLGFTTAAEGRAEQDVDTRERLADTHFLLRPVFPSRALSTTSG
jgi:hypothetical protein